ncbi:response regulator transcription factor [Desulfosporosinus sp. FKA]|uniref:response regulator transcription factor n=1 Tax=Desulfosporosinus sp. FKA TaxID=1969834 RepID=UPI000B4A1E59|nr:response regulator transcription factor [Desulfosporosinus sp. FKA]
MSKSNDAISQLTEKLPILLIEDDITIRRFVEINLKRSGFQVMAADSGETGLSLMENRRPALVVLDVMLPGIDGYQVCSQIRDRFPEVAVLMLTALSQDLDKVMGFEFGADDYLVKPFNPLELVARIRAILRRFNKDSGSLLCSGSFRCDLRAQQLFMDEREIELTPQEFRLIKVFLEHRGQALSRDDLLNLAWGEDFVGDPKTVDVHVRRLREKIGNAPSTGRIETVWGSGYRWREGS